MQRDTCPIGGWPGRTSRPSWAAGAAKAPEPWHPTTRTRRPSGSKPLGWPCARPLVTRPIPSGSPPPCPPISTRRMQLRLQRHLRLPGDIGAYDFGGALRSGMGCLIAALRGGGDRPGGGRGHAGRPAHQRGRVRRRRRRGGRARRGGPRTCSPSSSQPASATTEFTDRWRAPGDRTSKLWEERFGENRYLALGQDALARALKLAGVEASDVGRLVVTGMHGRAVTGLVKKLGLGESVAGRRPRCERGPERHGPPAPGPGRRTGVDGRRGHAGGNDRRRRCTSPTAPTPWSYARPRRWPAGARFGRSPSRWPTARRSPMRSSWPGGGSCSPSRPGGPEPARVSSTAAYRNEEWKFGFVGSKDRSSGAVHLPPSRVSMEGGAVDDMEPVAMADATGTVVTSTIDRLAYSPSPPISVRRRGLRRGRSLPGRADRRRPRGDPRRQPGRNDVSPAVQRRRHS